MKKAQKGRRATDGRATRNQRLEESDLAEMIRDAELAVAAVRAEVESMHAAGIVSVAVDGAGKIARGSQLIREFAAKLRVGITGEIG